MRRYPCFGAISFGLAALGLLLVASPAQAHVLLLEPNGGEQLEVGSIFTITWKIEIAHSLLNWDLWYSTTSATGPWITIAMNLAPGSPAVNSIHTYDWTVPNAVDDSVWVRVRMDNSGKDYYDESDLPFSIVPPAPPPGVPGLSVQKFPNDDTRLRLTFDTMTCEGNVGHHLVYGFGSQLPSAPGGTLLVDGSRCLVASPYTWVDVPVDPSDLLWFLVLANDGGTIEGSWGLDGAGSERQGPGAGGSSGVCGISAKDTANACGR